MILNAKIITGQETSHGLSFTDGWVMGLPPHKVKNTWAKCDAGVALPVGERLNFTFESDILTLERLQKDDQFGLSTYLVSGNIGLYL